MICSYGDYTDVLLFRELGLEEIIAAGTGGRLTEAGGRRGNIQGVPRAFGVRRRARHCREDF